MWGGHFRTLSDCLEKAKKALDADHFGNFLLVMWECWNARNYFGAHNIILEGDCLPLINMLKSSQNTDTTIGFFIRDILFFVVNFDLVSWSFVKRGSNRVAYDCADRHPYHLEGVLYESVVPEDVLSRALDDMYVDIDDNLM